MSRENVEVVRRAAEAFGEGGLEANLAFYTEDVIWFPFPDAPEKRDGYHGHADIRALMDGWFESFDDFSAWTDEIRDLGDSVVGLGAMSGTMKGSRVRVEQPLATISWDFRDGKIGKVRFFPSWEQALEAVGLSE